LKAVKESVLRNRQDDPWLRRYPCLQVKDMAETM